MSKTATCTRCAFKKERQQTVKGVNKTFYDWNVSFDNGDYGLCGTSTNEAPFQLNASCEYDIEVKTGTNADGTPWSFNKISKPKSAMFGGAPKRDDSKERVKAHALRCAMLMYTNNSLTLKEEEVKDGIPDGVNSFTKTVVWLNSTMQASLEKYGKENVFIIMEAMSLSVEARKVLSSKDMVNIYNSTLKSLLDV